MGFCGGCAATAELVDPTQNMKVVGRLQVKALTDRAIGDIFVPDSIIMATRSGQPLVLSTNSDDLGSDMALFPFPFM